NAATEVREKNVQYNTVLTLASGGYHLKFVVREKQTGRMGSFETDLAIPELKAQPLKMSSIVLASQLQPARKSPAPNPLVREGSEVIPNVTHVFSTAQHLLLYYEVYDPARVSVDTAQRASGPGIHLLSNVAFFRGKAKVFESS